MNRRTILKTLAAVVPGSAIAGNLYGRHSQDTLVPGSVVQGPFKPTWSSLEQYTVPEWYRDAKFGIWAHWGPQCQPEYGDWYARELYQENSEKYKYHLSRYGHPSKVGFKDVIHEWKAEAWDPYELVELYKRAGAKYFMALANHHDNFDNYASSHHAWNSVNMGPKKDLIDGWAKATRKAGLNFGVSVHAAHAWSWYETAQRSDSSGPNVGIPYDGKLTKADGKGLWWQGYDPQDLYAQNHALSANSNDNQMIHKQWHWGNGVSVPSKAYCEKFLKRTVELIDKYDPDVVYFDDTALPLWPISDVGLQFAAHYYNRSKKNKGKVEVVINGKILDEQQRKAIVWDLEKGAFNGIEPFVWQTCTCIGGWHYDRSVYDNNGYKSAQAVIHILCDVVSKNGNLLLSVPVRGNGTIDEKERAVVEEIGQWMQPNGEAIYGTRPWKVFGEGPAMGTAGPLTGQGFNEGKGKPLGSEDFRFTKKNDSLYAMFFGWPENKSLLLKSLAQERIQNVKLLGYSGPIEWSRDAAGVTVKLPEQLPGIHAYTLKFEGIEA